jgi:hypothetical protein
MHYVPWNDTEIAELNKKITAAKVKVVTQQNYLASLEDNLGKGRLVLDTNFAFQYPEPNCYHCVNSSGHLLCLKHHKYGVACEEYKHWRDK